jgi:hypothetical protein
MALEMVIDHWNPSVWRCRQERFCCGPKSCLRVQKTRASLNHGHSSRCVLSPRIRRPGDGLGMVVSADAGWQR